VRLACLWVCVLGAGCSQSTTILIDARVAAGELAPTSLTVSVFDPHGVRVADRSLGAARLPGTVLITGLPDEAQLIRVVLTATGPRLLGWARVVTEPNAEVHATIELSTTTADSDGDGVPDPVDLCPDTADPQQRDENADGVGDVCAAVADLAIPADLAGADLAGLDLAVVQPDLAGADLSRSFSDASIDAGGGSRCATAGLLLCDGFENGFNSAVWAKRIDRRDDGGMPTVDVDTTRAYRGTHALHAHVDPINSVDSYLQAKVRQDTAAPAPVTYLRAFFYLSSSLMTENAGLMSVDQEAEPYGGMFIDFDTNKLDTGTYVVDPGFHFGPSVKTIPFDQWFCLEWEVVEGVPQTTDMGTGSIRVWLNDTEIPEFTQGAMPNQPFFGSSSFGLELNASRSLPALDLWVDEIAVDDSPIGCAN
jgi:hypothetical protein